MRALANADHRAEHHHPDEEEAAELLGPDPGRDQRGIAGDDLQRDGDDQDRNRPHHQPREQPMVPVDQALHLIALILARIWSAPISFAYAAITGSTSFFISSRPAKGTRFSLPSFSILTSFASSSLDSTCRPYAPASLPALITASCRALSSVLNVFTEKHSGRIVIACCVIERFGATSKNFICSTPAASFSPAAI